MFSETRLKLVLFVTVFCGQTYCSYDNGGHGGGGGGSSMSKRQQDDWGNYMFTYEIKDHHGAQNYRSEKGDKDNNVEGSYGIQDVDGRMRVVDYWADKKNGFVAKIRSNEPGVSNQDSADAIFNGLDKHGGGGGKEQMDIDHSQGHSQGYGGGAGAVHNGGQKESDYSSEGGQGGYQGGKWE